MSTRSGFYAGSVAHWRVRPASHRLRYRIFWLLVDLDELPSLTQRLRLFSVERFNVFSLHSRDHGAGDGHSLRDHIECQLRAAQLPTGGTIQLLCMPRVLGYVFNPLSVYLCRGAQGELQAVVYEVNNTFGERHCYLIEVPPEARFEKRITQHCAKQLHVSPFLDLDMRYRFDIEPPGPDREGLRIAITASDAQGPMLVAHMEAQRRPLTDRVLAVAFFTYPLLTLKVVAAIHWEALLLWLKGIRLRPHPGDDVAEVSITRNKDS